MQKVNLYRYEDGNTIVITPNPRNETDEPSRMRLIADENSGYNTLTEREDDFPSFEIPEETPTEKEVVIE